MSTDTAANIIVPPDEAPEAEAGSPSGLRLDFAARSDTGPVRSSNQDSGYAGPNMLVVADGMGGHAGGDIASRLAIAALRGLDSPTHTTESAVSALENSLVVARSNLVKASAAEPMLSGLGTTVTALLKVGSALVMAHMGDSRAYLLRDETLTQVTVDHTLVQHLVDTGRLRPEEAAVHPQRNIVMRVLTDVELAQHADMSIREAKEGDRWLLCSDGLSGFLEPEMLAQLLSDAATPSEAADALVEAAIDAGSSDNVTAIIADVIVDDETAIANPGNMIVGAAEGLPAVEETPTGAIAAVVPRVVAAQAEIPAVWAQDEGPGLQEETPVHADADADGAVDPDDPGGQPPPRRRPLVAAIITLLIFAGLGVGAWQGYEWTQRQYFVGVSHGQVAIFRGIPASAGPITLNRPVEFTGTLVEDLPPLFRERLEQTIRADSFADAQERAERLIEEALPDDTAGNGEDTSEQPERSRQSGQSGREGVGR